MRLLPLLMTALACAPDLRVDHPFDGAASEGPLVSTETLAPGVTLMHVDATNKNARVYVDLDRGVELKVDEAFATNQWDLAFKRYEIALNGGAGNPSGSVEAIALEGQDFDALQRAPATGYLQDGATQVLGGWYAYDLLAHRVVTRSDIVYVIRSSEGVAFKLKMLDYYDAAGTPAALTLKYGALAAP